MRKILRFITQRVVLTALLIVLQALLLFGIIWKLNNYFVYFYAASVLLSLLLTLRIINNKSNPAFKIAWLIPILLFPVLGGLVYLAGALKDHVGIVQAWMTVMGLCGGILFLLGLYHIRMLPSGGAATAHADSFGGAMRETKRIFLEFFKKKYIWIYFAFILFYRFAEGLVIKIVPLFLNAPLDQQGMGLTEQQIGLYYGTFGVIAFVVGSILGGYFISWLKLRRALFPLVCIFNVPFVVYALLAWFQPSSPVLICAAIVFEYFSYGFGFVGLTLFIMQQVAPGPHQMAHYAFGSSLANLGVMLPGMISGWLCDSLGGYHYFFMWALLATVPAFLLAARIPFTHPDTEEVTAEEIDKELINE